MLGKNSIAVSVVLLPIMYIWPSYFLMKPPTVVEAFAIPGKTGYLFGIPAL